MCVAYVKMDMPVTLLATFTGAGDHRHFIANTDNDNTTGDLNGGTHLIYKYTKNSYENFELMGSNSDSNIGLTSTNGNHTHSISATGDNQPHENRPLIWSLTGGKGRLSRRSDKINYRWYYIMKLLGILSMPPYSSFACVSAI